MMEMNESIVAIQISYCSFFCREYPQDVFFCGFRGFFFPRKEGDEKRNATAKAATATATAATVQKHGTDRTTETTLGLRHVCHSTTLVGLAVASAPALNPFGHRHAKFYAQ
jgi:hypothetical protein